MMDLTAEEFIREKIRFRDQEKGAMNALIMYDCTGEEALRWAHEFAELKINNAKKNDINTNLLGTPFTIGELKKLISKYPNNTPFGFRNQPIQDLYEVKHENKIFVVFQ